MSVARPCRSLLRTGALALLSALPVIACDAGFSNPLASFETRCAELPATRFEVIGEPVTYTEDGAQSIDQLTMKSGRTPAGHMTFGLTIATFGHMTQVQVRSVEDRANARACGTLDVRVKLSMQPMTVYTAEELGISRCARTATWEHEMQHVAVFRNVLDQAVAALAADIGGRIGMGIQRSGSQAELERRLNGEVTTYLSRFIADWQRTLNERQDAVDSPQEYARVSGACAQ